MSMIKEFKEFAMKGNVVDLAVGVVIGVAFGKVVIPWSMTLSCPDRQGDGQCEFRHLFFNLDRRKLAKDGSVIKSLAQAKEAGAAVMRYAHSSTL